MQKQLIIGGLPLYVEGLNYLVPTDWYVSNHVGEINFIKIIKKLKIIVYLFILNLKSTIQCTFSIISDDFLEKYKENLLEILEQKTNYLRFQNIKINLQINKLISWSPISPQIWKKIVKKLKIKYSVLTLVSKQFTQLDYLNTQNIVFCSKLRSDVFIGYLPKKSNLAQMIRQIGYEMGFVQVQKTRVVFIQKQPLKNIYLHDLQHLTIQDVNTKLFMTFNLQRKEEEHLKLNQNQAFLQLYQIPEDLNSSNYAVAGDLITNDDNNNMNQQQLQNRTMSTGAQTPFSLNLSQGFNLDSQYRVSELFGMKQPQQIIELRQKADKIINNQIDLIQIPNQNEEEKIQKLQKLAEQLLQHIMKKKVYKEKQSEVFNQ